MKTSWLLLAVLGLALCVSSLAAASHAPLRAERNAAQPSAASPAPVSEAPAAGAPAAQVPAATAQPEAAPKVTAYTLPPDLYKKARNLSKIHFRLALIGFVYGLAVLWLILRLKLGAKYRDWCERLSHRRSIQALVFAPLLILTMDILGLPTEIYGHWVSKSYGLSIQGWRSWAWDCTKGEFLGVILGTILIAILFAVIRKSPRSWWFYFWLVSLPIGLILVFMQPLVIDPMFHKFEPLQKKDAVLTAGLERMVQRAGQNIPPERMFWMGAGEKTTAVNAYVTGVGASKRIVVWDTTIAKMTTPQIVYVAGHEMGHYVLNHLPKGLGVGAVFLFVLFYLGFRSIGWVLARWGGNWGLRGLDDWASLPALLILISIFAVIVIPISSAVSRHYEHQADQYGLEVTHGLTANSGQVAAQAFQVLGEVNLADPEPNRVNVFLFYSHPPIADRIRFCLAYDPWSKGEQPRFVK